MPVHQSLPSISKLHGLDHLRAFAIIAVFLYHYSIMFPHPQWLEAVSKFGWTGVDLFFVLSGYLIASQLFKSIRDGKGIALRTFFIKRFFRIIPAYAVVVAIYFCLPVVREKEALAPLWKYLTFTQNLGLDLRTQGAFSHAWSLCIEEQFYLLLPLILAGLATLNALRTGPWLLVVLLLFGAAARCYSYHYFVMPYVDDDTFGVRWYKAIYYPTWCRLDSLLTGVSLAAFTSFKPVVAERFMRYGNALFFISICLLTAAYFLCYDQMSFSATVFGFPLIAIGYGVMVLSAITPTSFLYKIHSTITTTIASLSYGVYLIHKMVIHLTQGLFEKMGLDKEGNTMFFICIMACLLGALALNKLVEKPFLKWRNRFIV